MRLYIELVKMWYRWASIYKVEYLLSIITNSLFILIYVQVWRVLYQSRQSVDGIQLEQMVTYSTMGILSMVIMRSDTEIYLMEKIRNGDIIYDLARPYDFQLSLFARNVGTLFFGFLGQIIPCAIISFCLLGVDFSIPTNRLFAFLISWAFGFLIMFGINFILGIFSFWVQEIWGLVTFKDSVFRLFSGATVPLWFFPGYLQIIADLLPFKAVVFWPLAIFIGAKSGEDTVTIILQQLVWIGVFWGIGKLMVDFMRRKLSVNGG